MRNQFNSFFLDDILKDAKIFDIAKIKLVYNFTLFYYVLNILTGIVFLFEKEYLIGFSDILISSICSGFVLYFLKKRKLDHAIYSYLSLHLIIGTCIFFMNKGQWSITDGAMTIVLITFTLLTLGIKRGLLWLTYLMAFIILGIVDEAMNGQLLNFETEALPEQPDGMLFMPIAMIVFILFVYTRSKIKAEDKIQKQKSELSDKNKEILDSIAYAKRIQSAILPSNRIVKTCLQNSFILYKPKDIVAGDFYWLEQKNDQVIFAAADCTGHGVPGAMVSVVCNNALNRSVREFSLNDPGQILDKTREIVIQEFEKSEEEVKDGMDIALCSLRMRNENEENAQSVLKFAGAHNPLWVIRKGTTEVEEFKADKQPIGKFGNALPFTTHEIHLKEGDSFYIFSDGFADQFGGEKGKKFKAKNFKDLLLSVQDKSMEEQKEVIDEAFEKWKGNLEQLDDVCVIGVRI